MSTEKARAASRRWRKRNPKKALAILYRWRKEHPVKARRVLRRYYKKLRNDPVRWVQHLKARRDWKRKHRAVVSRRNKRWRKLHPRLQKQQRKRQYHKHKKKHAQYNAQWARKNRQRVLGYSANWRRRHPIKSRMVNMTNQARWRAKICGSGGSFTAQEWKRLCVLHGKRCAACRKHRRLTPDHVIPISKGGHSFISNIQPLCKPCNRAKGNKTIRFAMPH